MKIIEREISVEDCGLIITAEEEQGYNRKGQTLRLVVLGCLAVIGLIAIGSQNYLLFHALVELGAVAVAWGVVLLVWNAKHFRIPPAFMLLGVGYGLVGFFDLLHTLAYEGMGVFSGSSADLATQLWLAARFIEAAALSLFLLGLVAGVSSRWGVYALAAAAFVMLGGLFVWDYFPECFNAETGLTTFKIGSEYGVMVVLGGSLVLTYKKRNLIDPNVARFLSGAILLTIVSEFFFTIYSSPFGPANMIGHIFKVASFVLIYRALIVESLDRPMEILAHGLRKETERYARIIETAVDGFWIVDMQGRLREVNASAERMTGLPRHALLSMSIKDIEVNESAEEITRRMKRVVEKGCDLFETRHRHKNGSVLDVEVSCSFLPYDPGQFIVFVRDISERKIAETQLKLHAALLEQVSDAIIATDLELNITSWNSAAERIYGWRADEAQGQHVDRLLNTGWFDELFEEAQRSLKETGNWKDAIHQQSKDGEMLVIEASVSWIYDVNGTRIGVVTVNRDITDRKIAEDLLRRSEKKYRSIVTALPDLLFRIDAKLQFVDVQTSIPELLLAPAEEMLGKTVWEILPPNIADMTDEHVQATLQSGKMRVYDYTLNIEGVDKEFETRMVACSNEEVLAIVRDVTEARVTNRLLRESEKRLSLAVETARLGYWLWNVNTNEVSWFGGHADLFGIKDSEFKGTIDHVQEMVHPDDREKGIANLERAIVDNIPFDNTYRVIHPDGSVNWLNSFGHVSPDDQGKPNYIFGITRDISEFKFAEERLRLSELRYRMFFEQGPDGVVVIDPPKGSVIEFNEQACRQLGFTREEFSMMRISDVEDVNSPEKISDHIQNVIRGRRDDFETNHRTKNGEMRHFHVSAQTLLVGSRTVYHCICRDITEKKRATRLVEESEARYRGIVNVLPDLLFRIDAEMRFADVQTSVPEMLLAPIDEIIGKTAWEILPPDIADLTEEKVRIALGGGKMQVYHYSLDVRGVAKECETRMVPCGDDEVLAIVRDVTEAREIERRLQESQERYNAIVNDQTELICRFDTEGVLLFVNNAYCGYFGLSVGDLVGQSFFQFIPGKNREFVKQQFSSLTQEQPVTTYMHEVVDAGGQSRWMEWMDRALFNDRGEVEAYQAVGRDITERRILEQSLLKATEREQINLAVELHDGLCQDLKGLEILAALLEDGIGENNNGLKDLATDLSEGMNLAVLRAYGITQGMFPIDVGTKKFSVALQNLTEKAKYKGETRLLITVQDDLSPSNQSQAHQLYRIAQEAMNNALRHSKATKIELIWHEENGEKLLAVRDNGIGIGDKNQKTLGGGLGLQVMSARAQSINAGLTVRGLRSGGTEVLVRLKNE